MSASRFASDQPDDSNEPSISVLHRYKTDLISMRNLVLFQMSQPKITASTIEALERGLSDIIRGIDTLRDDPHFADISDTLISVYIDVRNARRCLNVASSISENTTRVSSIKMRFDQYDEFTDMLLDAIKLLEMVVT